MTPFRIGERVSLGSIDGTVVSVNGRLRVQRDDTAAYDWPDHWELGHGSERSTCQDCGRRFRHDPGDDWFFCQACTKATTAPSPRPERGGRLPPAPAVGIHIAGEVTGRDVRTQRCSRCGAVLARYCAYDRHAERVVPCTFYQAGALIERTDRGQGILIRVGAEPTCALKSAAEVA